MGGRRGPPLREGKAEMEKVAVVLYVNEGRRNGQSLSLETATVAELMSVLEQAARLTIAKSPVKARAMLNRLAKSAGRRAAVPVGEEG